MVLVKPKHYWLYSCSVAGEDTNLDNLYKDGWKAVQMAASADGETVILLLEKGPSLRKK
jgi:hypothetical protein